MNRLKKIFAVAKLLSRTPGSFIAEKWAVVRASALPHKDSVVPGSDPLTAILDGPFKEAVVMLDNIISAVVGIAEDTEKPAAKPAAKVVPAPVAPAPATTETAS